jgi:hypothetical protein
MTEFADATEMLIGYTKFLAVRAGMSLANRKYRATEHGKEKTRIMHRLWCENHKDDLEYKKQTNLKAKERYHIRKAKIIESVELRENPLKNDKSTEEYLRKK